MAFPIVLTKLNKGKILDAQPGFVETFNFIVDFIKNLKGDKDLSVDGRILLDRTIPDFPVIKYRGGGGGGGGGDGMCGGFAYDAVTKTIGPGAISIGRQYIPVNQGGTVTTGEGDWRIEVSLDTGTAIVASGDGFDSPTKTRSYIPLYQLVNGNVAVDYRGAANVQVWEDYEE